MIRFFVSNAALVFVAVVAITLFGAWSYVSLPREAAPDIKIPVVLVTTPYPGVSPGDVEGLVTIPLENELAGLRDVKEMASTSAEGFSLVSIEFEPDVVIEDALQKVRDRVNRAKPKLPGDVEEPQVREVSFSDIPVLIVTIAGTVDETELKRLAERMSDDAVRIDGVLDAKISGGVEREIHVLLDPARLNHYGLKFSDVTGALANENVNIPGGDVRVGQGNVLLRVPGEFTTVDELEGVAVKRVGDRPVTIRDIGRVEDGFAERETYARMNGEPSVSVSVTKRAGANIVAVADDVKELVEAQSAAWPDGVTYRVLADQSENIRSMVKELQNNIITALLLVVGVLVFFMGFRSSLFVAIAIPLSMFMSFMVLDVVDFTLNMVVLFSLILALGMLVDNGIVVVENIFRHVEEGKPPVQAAVDGTSEVAVAVAASTATTVAAFFPMIFWGGIMGGFMGYLPKTVIIVLTASLVVATVLLPAITSRLMPREVGKAKAADPDPSADALAEGSTEAVDVEQLGGLMRAYTRVLQTSIAWRYASLGAMVALFLGTFVAFGFLNSGTEFFPSTEPDRATVGLRAPDGTDLETTDRLVRLAERVLAQERDVDVYVAETGVQAGGGPFASNGTPNQAKITIDFLPHPAAADPGETPRADSSDLTVEQLREALQATITGAEVTVEVEEMGPPVGADIEVLVYGDDFEEVGAVAQRLKRELAAIDGITDLKDDFRVNRPELALRIDRVAAKRVGVSTAEVGNTVRNAVAGTTATTLRDGEDEYDIVVKLAPEHTDDVQSVLDLRLPGRAEKNPDTFAVPLSAVASYELAGGSGSVRHKDQDLVITLTADVKDGFNVNEVQGKVRAHLAQASLPDGFYTRLAGSTDEQNDAFGFLTWALSVAVVLVFIVLVAQFNDLMVPGIILGTVVLSFIGVLWGLILTSTPFGLMTFIGIISLAGVVVNNAIVLLDYVRQLERGGMTTTDALIKAGLTRFRPVMLTAITTVLGLVPMAAGISLEFGLSEAWLPTFRLITGSPSSGFWGPMAVAVIAGLAFATVLTLVMVPTLYSIYDDFRGLMQRLFSTGDSPSGTAAGVAAKLLVGAIGAGVLGGGLLLSRPAQAVTLEEAYAAAIENNLDWKMAQEQTFQAENQLLRAWSLVQPTISLSGSYQINEIEQVLDPSSLGGSGLDDTFGYFGELAVPGYQSALYYELIQRPLIGAQGFDLPPLGVFPDEVQAELDRIEADGGLDFGASEEELRAQFEALYPTEPPEQEEAEPFIVQRKAFAQGALSIRQPLWNGSAIPLLIGAYKQQDAARLDESRTLQQIKAAIARAFFGLASANEAVKLSGKALELSQSQLTLAERQVDAGLAPSRTRLQAQLRVSQAERDLQNARQSQVAAAQAFARLTGLPGDSVLELTETPTVPASVDAALETAFDERPDLEAAEGRVEVAQLQVTADTLGWMPTVNGNFNWIATENVGFGEPTFWTLTFDLNWTLWDGGLRLATIRESASNKRLADLQAEKARQTAEEEVRVAWESWKRAQLSASSVEREVALAEENLRLARTGFEAGTATWLEVEQAELGLQQARLVALQERTNLDTAAIDLLVATGTF